MITGATGFVGGWTARALAERGHDLRFLVRNPDKLHRATTALGIDGDVVVGDITDAATVRRALDGCEAVVHTAAEVALQGADEAAERALVERNLEGARNVIGGATTAGAASIVHVSSCVVLWPPGSTVLRDPRAPLEESVGVYGHAKTAVERYVRGLQDGGAPISITYPVGVIGPGIDGYVGEAGEGMHTLLRAGVVGRTAGLTLVDVRDLADLHARLVEPGVAPRRVIAGGHRITGPRLATALTEASGQRVRYWPIPNSVMIGVGKLADRYRDRVPDGLEQISDSAVRYLLHPPVPVNDAAEELGVSFRPVENSLASVFGRA
ncbi:NAD-dependent epimerase/dehydratase family protein [Gordonia sp. (in: high G+C Gram-positive bacteria)]|uniref:NAD-dependent epimerase/dehydratase family protein n=1 Tax=Gordonia sp. (in: high G+C Gram-positive bacteria) TaxID=84139 RepID=UPI0039E5AC1C